MTIVATPPESDEVGKPYDQFFLFGDSITQMSSSQRLGFGFHAALQDAYSRKLDVINRGFSGYTTAHAVKLFPKIFPPPQIATVRLMTIFFGANDACVPGHQQHVPLDQYKANLKYIVQHPATRAQKPRIILLTPPPVNEYQLESFDQDKKVAHPSRTAVLAQTYAKAAREVAAELNIPVADIWTAFMTSTGWKEGEPLVGSRDLPNSEDFSSLFTDGLHLTPAGYRIIYAEVMKTILANFPDQDPDQLPMVFPGWLEAPR
ncbi:uncharacterized protein N7459_001873 [Penicillium hispanicum]|uniref:uncharacterized protein n=1 Tax=Penicillium hispanicum TaxID=1080232 RepID=UPI002541A7B4|nr:uncharacterized protein N7459_001873 [Penicillium hispanicum]KAJ5591504.1 hypothetical protein N7459_001873 [Penicillium hispanicum]